jgi:hypothetical protein
MGVGFDEQIKRIQKLYDQRSRYVHAGEPVREPTVGEARNICREVLWTLLRLQNGPKPNMTISEWLSTLDYIIAAIEAKRPVEVNVFAECGISNLFLGTATTPTP